MLKAEFDGPQVRVWTTDGEGVSHETHTFRPTVYVAGDDLDALASDLDADPKVQGTGFERWRTSLHAREPDDVLAVTLDRIDAVRPFAREVKHHHERGRHPPGTYRLYNVDLAPQFRYCLAMGTDPVPARAPRPLGISLPESSQVNDALDGLRIDGETASTDGDAAALARLRDALAERDPDVLVLSSGEIVPLVHELADELGVDLSLGRRPGYDTLAGANTYHSYGQAGHSPARYDVPGRVLIDRSNSFLWGESNLGGMLDLARRAGRPLQEIGWASIGTVLTAIEVREALDRQVLVPWNKWEPEAFKSVERLHAADRGGFIFAPEVGLHENVYELDFASLYPTIICEYNVSPETVDCDCHDRADVPEIGYSICDRDGFLPDVLEPLIDERARIKDRIAEADDGTERERLEARSSAIKWVLVSCFGYQGYRNAKFGRIECHEAINAYAREIALRAKERIESGGWRVVHGIVDSLWVTPAETDPEPLDTVAADVSAAVGVDLERDGEYEWVCFCPKRDSPGGALTRYFGKRTDGSFKFRGIEARQRSTPDFVASCQREFVERLDETRDPEAVCDRLQAAIARLRRGDVDPSELVITTRLSKPPGEYTRASRTAAAARRCQRLGRDRNLGQSVRYVVVDDDARQRERVRLAWESIDGYDADCYATLLVRAAESVTAPLGFEERDIRRYLRERTDARLDAFGA